MKELQPVNQNVLLDITEDNTEQKTASGLIIPDSAKETLLRLGSLVRLCIVSPMTYRRVCRQQAAASQASTGPYSTQQLRH